MNLDEEDLKTAFSYNDIQTCENFEEVVMIILDCHVPLKKKVLRTNNAHHLLQSN